MEGGIIHHASLGGPRPDRVSQPSMLWALASITPARRTVGRKDAMLPGRQTTRAVAESIRRAGIQWLHTARYLTLLASLPSPATSTDVPCHRPIIAKLQIHDLHHSNFHAIILSPRLFSFTSADPPSSRKGRWALSLRWLVQSFSASMPSASTADVLSPLARLPGGSARVACRAAAATQPASLAAVTFCKARGRRLRPPPLLRRPTSRFRPTCLRSRWPSLLGTRESTSRLWPLA